VQRVPGRLPRPGVRRPRAADSTLAAYERYLAAASARSGIDAAELARAYRRLGELYEAPGDVRRALQCYGDFAKLWQGADAALQPAVEEVRQRIRRLQATTGSLATAGCLAAVVIGPSRRATIHGTRVATCRAPSRQHRSHQPRENAGSADD